MKRTSLLIAFLCALLVGFGADYAAAQEGIVSLDHVDGLVSPNTVANSQKLRFVMRLNNDSGKKCDVSVGWRLFSPDGATWDSTTIDSCGPNSIDGENLLLLRFNTVAAFTVFSNEGIPPDTVGFLGAGNPTSASRQLAIGYNDTAMAVNAWVSNDANAGKHICVDSSFWEPGGVWKWVYNTGVGVADLFPQWTNQMGMTHQPGQGFCFQFEGGAAPIVLEATPNTLTFNATEGGANPSAQPFNITEQTAQLVPVSLGGYASWIVPTPTSGTTPQAISVGINIAGLAPGTYKDTIVVTGTGSTNSPTVEVILNVAAAPKTLVVAPDTLSFTMEEFGALPVLQNFNVSELGGGIIAFSASENTDWFSLTNAAGNTPQAVQVNIVGPAPAPGTYVGAVTFTSAAAQNSPVTRHVKLTVTEAPRVLIVAPLVLNFTAVEGGANPVAQNVAVTETNNKNVDFTANETATWISLANTDLNTPGGFDVNVDITGVGEGSYSDTITIAAAGVTNSPIKVAVNLTVSAPEVKLLTTVPDTLFFFATEGGANPDGEYMVIREAGGGAIAYSASTDVAHVLLSKFSGTTPDSIIVSVDITGLTPGVRVDSIQVSSLDADNSPRWVFVKLELTGFVCPTLTVSDTLFEVSVEAGQLASIADSVYFSSVGGALDWSVVSVPANFNIVPTSGTTPSGFAFSFSNTYNDPGTYTECFNVIAGINGEGLTCSTMTSICVKVTVTPVACAQLMLNDTLFQFTTIEGGTPTPVSRNLMVTTSNGSAVPVTVTRPIDADWVMFVNDLEDTVSTAQGMTPLNLPIVTGSINLTPGVYSAVCVVTSIDESVCSPAARTFVVMLTVEAEPEPVFDSIQVGTVAGQPGGVGVVPVYLTNGCDLTHGSLPLRYNGLYLLLDSVSYADSRLPGSAVKIDLYDLDGSGVTISFETQGLDVLTPGSGLWANLFFSISENTPLGSTLDVVVGQAGPSLTRDCGQGPEVIVPSFIAGGLVVDEILTDTICGYVTDENGTEIEGAVVQLWADFPNGSPEATTTTNENGAFFFPAPFPMPYDVYAYADGYYPNWHLNQTGTQCGTIVLRALPNVVSSDRWVDYFCGNATIDDSMPIPVGSVVEVKDPDGTIAGRQIVTEPGVIRFMPVYRDSAGSVEDEGAETGDMLWFYVNGQIAETSPLEVFYPADYAQVEVCVNGSLRGGKACQLLEGWNLVSWNVDTPEDSIEVVLGEIMDCVEVVLGFEGGGLTYDPELEQFSTLWHTDHLSGYWIKVKVGCAPELRLAGSVVPANTPIPVYQGWNLVSYLPEMNLTPVEALATVSDKLMIAYGYENGIQVYQVGQPNFNTLEEMMTCHGYWMKLTAADVLVYPGGVASAPMAIENPRAMAARVAAASDVATTIAWVNLYSRNLTLDGKSVGSGSQVEAYTLAGNRIGSFRMNRDGQFGFMPVYSDAGLNESITGIKAGDKFTLRVDGVETAETFTWTTNGDRIEVGRLTSGASTGSLPGSFSLAQNYPNPFNPTTTISFSLPAKGQARIEIYNVLGKLVAVPFDGVAEAGDHQVVWNGKNDTGEAVASGVYFYRLTADNYTDTKKMMLLK